MTNESLTKIVDAIFEKYERSEAIQLTIELLQEKNAPFIPQVWGGTDSNGNRIKDGKWTTTAQARDLKGVEEYLGQ